MENHMLQSETGFAEICDNDQLKCEIERLQLRKELQEMSISLAIKDIGRSLNPVQLAKDSIHSLASVKPPTQNVVSMGTHIGSQYFFDRILGKNKSIKGFITSILVEKISAELINRNAPELYNEVLQLGKQVGIDLDEII